MIAEDVLCSDQMGAVGMTHPVPFSPCIPCLHTCVSVLASKDVVSHVHEEDAKGDLESGWPAID